MNIKIRNQLDHLLYMTNNMPIKEDNPFKWNRWLGFIQGAMWDMDIFTIDELKFYNKNGLQSALDKLNHKIRMEIAKMNV